MFKSTSKVFLASMLIGMTLLISGCDGKKAAKEEIEQKGITYNIDSFADAIASKNTDVINLFIKAGIDASSPKALGAVIESNDPILLEKLLDEDLNPNIKITTDGSNAPLLNKIVSSPEMLKVLLEADDLYINAQDNEGNTALMQAMIDNQPASVTLLVEANADVNMRNKEGFDTYILALGDVSDNRENRRDEMKITALLKALGEKLNPNATLDNLAFIKEEKVTSYTLLHLAAESGMKDLVSFLIEKGANVNAKLTYPDGMHKSTPLDMALRDDAIINILLDHGANHKKTDDIFGEKESRIELLAFRMQTDGLSEKTLKRLGATKEEIRKAKELNSADIITAPAITEEVTPAAEAVAY